ncbi:hypothetical protein [Streptomyces palmae]|uniref:DUF3039 domain-containing protein n=1 Tax=Streptomyces palmae TaxID=1701085 RepID=A0A4Z0HBP4_9ACTN|nr:hypothetical protein [Streptomyces palmae]TGB14671.1 hypothetical protein E4099_07960 [Streptomyces palmae]
MQHEMRAEYEEGSSGRVAGAPVMIWHMVRGAGTAALCGRELAADAETLPAEEWGAAEETRCHSCDAVYLREVP